MRILIIAPAWVGDAVMSQSVLIGLKAQYPDATIDVLTSALLVPLFERMAQVNATMIMPLGHGKLGLLTRFKIARMLKGKHYDCAYVLPNSWKSALIPFLARIPVRIGYVGEMRYGLLTDAKKLDKAKLSLMVERYAALAACRPVGVLQQSCRTGAPQDPAKPWIPAVAGMTAGVQTALKKFSLNTNQPIFALCPGAAFGPSKRWPPEYFAEVAKQKLVEGYQVWIFGAPSDQDSCEAIHRLVPQAVNLCGKTTLAEMIDLLSCSHLVLTNDSGPMHIAAALGCPLVAIFGASSPEHTPPLSKKAIVLENKMLDCHPCFERTCRYGHYKCLTEITPSLVLSALSQLENHVEDHENPHH